MSHGLQPRCRQRLVRVVLNEACHFVEFTEDDDESARCCHIDDGN